MTIEIETLLDFSASMCIIDKELVQWHKMILVKKNMQIAMEVIVSRTWKPTKTKDKGTV
jgi:hypothetical protein